MTQTTNEAADRLREMLEGDRITRSGRLLGLGDLTLALATERRNVVAEIRRRWRAGDSTADILRELEGEDR